MMPVPTLDGITVDMPPHFGGDELHTSCTEHDRRKNTTVAEVLRPALALYLKITCEATNGSVWSVWVAEPGDEAILMVAHNPDVMPREIVDLIVAMRHGVPREIVEVDFDAFRSERLAAATVTE